MTYVHILLVFLLVYCDLCHAAFCSDDELAGECFDDKIKPMAIGAAVVAFILGISTILLAVALLCKAKRRHRAKVMVYRQPYKKENSLRGTHDNTGFESASQYHVKRPVGMSYQEPTYIVTRNAAKPSRGRDDNIPMAVLAEDERTASPASSGMMWVPTDQTSNDKRFRTNPLAQNGIYQ